MLLIAVSSVLVLIHFLPPKQNLIHSLFHIDLRVIISESDANDGICLDLP